MSEWQSFDAFNFRLERHRSLPTLQPFCPIIIKCTREVAGFNSLADVLKRLDFRSAVHDIRRFQYVSAILKLLLTPEKLYQLAGASQKLIFRFCIDFLVNFWFIFIDYLFIISYLFIIIYLLYLTYLIPALFPSPPKVNISLLPTFPPKLTTIKTRQVCSTQILFKPFFNNL